MTDTLPVLGNPVGPLLALMCLAIGVLVIARVLTDRGAPVLELGVFYSLVVALYGIYPLAVYWHNGFVYLPTNEQRLFLAQPSPAEVASIAWSYVIYLAAFAMAYFLVRGRIAHRSSSPFPDSRHGTIILVLGAYLLIEASLLTLKWLSGQETTTYASTYLQYKALPLWVQQLAKHMGWMATALKVVAVTALLTNLRRYGVVLAAWIAVEAFLAAFRLGSRTELFLMVGTIAVGYDYIVHPLKAKHVVALAAMGLLLFMALGAIRSAGVTDQALLLVTTNAGEFESIFANALDITRLVRTGELGDVPASAFLGDILSFVPQQLLPFEKRDFSTWYVTTFYREYHEIGGGMAFGVIPESTLGLGEVELGVRGLATGILFAIATRAAMDRSAGFWIAAFYVWLTVQSYWTFRVGSTSLLPKLILGFIPAVVLTEALKLLLTRRGRSLTLTHQ